MKWKDSEEEKTTGVDRQDLSFDGDTFSLKNENGEDTQPLNPFKKNLTPIVMIAAGVVVLIVLMMVILSGPGKQDDSMRFSSLEADVKRLQDRVDQFEDSLQQRQDDARKGEAALQNRIVQLDRLEASVAKRMNAMAEEIKALKKASTVVRKRPAAASVPKRSAKPAAAGYHEVKAGENLYRIGLRYGLKVEELLRLNGLDSDSVISPGQKLKVSP